MHYDANAIQYTHVSTAYYEQIASHMIKPNFLTWPLCTFRDANLK